MDEQPAKTVSPPYIPFKTVSNWIEKIEPKGLPPQIDKSLLTSMAGGQRIPFLATLKWLGLTSDDGTVQPKLKEMVAAKPDDRRALLGAIIEDKYPWITPLSAQNATLGQLEKSFEGRGPSGSTLRKCIVFYLQAAEYCGITISQHFKVRGYISKTGRSTARQAGRMRADGEGATAAPPPPPPASGTDALKLRYIEMLMKKAEDKDDPELLDRIEKLLGQTEAE